MVAARIPDSVVDQVLSRTDLVSLISIDVPLQKKGRHFFGLCPFHQEKTASFSVDPIRQSYYCFGCGASGRAVQFLMSLRHLSFRDAMSELARPLGIVLETETDEHAEQKTSYFTWIKEAAQVYQTALSDHPLREKAVQYLKSRGLNGHIAKRFGLGFAPPGGVNLKSALSGGTIEEWSQLGLFSQREGGKSRETFSNRVIFPIRDVRGRVIGLGGRTLASDFKGPKYLNSPESLIFHKRFELYGLHEALAHQAKIHYFLMVEGYLDVIALHQLGIGSAIATLGTAVGPDHLEKALRYVNEIIFCFDGDEAGVRAAHKSMALCVPYLSQGRTFRFMMLPEGEDPDSYIRKQGKDFFEEAMLKSPPWPDFLLSVIREKTDLNQLEGQIQVAAEMKSWIEKIPDRSYREIFAESVSKALNVSPGILNAVEAPVLKAVSGSQMKKSPPIKGYQRPKLSWVERALCLLLKKPGLIDQLSSELLHRFQICFAPPRIAGDMDSDFPILWEFLDRGQSETSVDFFLEILKKKNLEEKATYLLKYDFALPEAYWAEELRGVIERLIQDYEKKQTFSLLLSSVSSD